MTEISPSISSQIIEVLDNLAQKFGIAIDWTSQNVIPYLMELMDKYVKYRVTFLISIFAILFLVSGLMIIIPVRNIKKKGDDYDIDYLEDCINTVVMIFGVLFFVLTLIIFLCNLSDIIACFVFPEKIILDYISSLMS